MFVFVKDNARADEIKDTWYQVRKKVGDIRAQLPAGVQGPFFNDEYGETFGNIYALTGDGFGYAQLKEHADRIRAQLLRVKDVAKVELIGEQDERIYVELANAKLATFGVEPAVVFAALQQQNAVSASGSFETATDRVYLRPTGALDSVDSVKQLPVRANGRLFRIGDIATVSRGYVDPPAPRMRFMGRDALGVAVSMAVSYTHLDVYKRQRPSSPPIRCAPSSPSRSCRALPRRATSTPAKCAPGSRRTSPSAWGGRSPRAWWTPALA